MRSQDVDDMSVRVARDILGPRQALAIKAALAAERAGATPEDAEEIGVGVLHRQRTLDEDSTA